MTNCPTCQRDLVAGESCRRLACLWHDIAAAALELDMFTIAGSTLSGPAVIRERIMSTHDRLPGGSRSSESGIRASRMEPCMDPTCPQGAGGWRHDHPVPVDPTGDAAMRPSKSEADLGALQTALRTFVSAVGDLAALSHSRGTPRTWDEAVTDAVLLDDMDAIDVLESSGQKPRRWVIRAGDAIHDIELIRDRHCTRNPNDWERSWTSDVANENDACRICRQLGLIVDARRDKGGRDGRCQGCNRLRKRCAVVNNIELDEVPEPPVELIEELRRIGSPGSPNDLAARSRWFQEVGAQAKERRRIA